ncbi:MAG: D-alanyl-D-alanine carboxypeptidase/D-alanyl-D-alanine-endopeptidase [Phycisphaerae bacterium]
MTEAKRMITRFTFVALGVLALGAPQAWGQLSLERRLRSAMANVPHARTIRSACVIDLSDGVPVYEENADRAMVPASTMKVFVMAAALTVLGPDFSFDTKLLSDGRNLIVIGAGDPAFGDASLSRDRSESITAEFDRWVAALKRRGISRISGDIVIDESLFDGQRIHPTWEAADLDKAYAAPVGALNYHDNCVTITISPASQLGEPVLVSFQPRTTLVEIVNGCRSGGANKPILRHRYDSFEYRLSGRCKARWPFGPVSFPDPGLLFADALQTRLLDHDIVLRGKIRRAKVSDVIAENPGKLSLIATKTTPLSVVLRRIGKDSENLFAECLFKRVGYEWARRNEATDPVGSWATGRAAVEAMVRRAGVDAAGLKVADGSGLSRDNACSAHQLAALLAWMYKRPEGTALRESLSIAGVDGSLARHLRDRPGAVFAKTGTMRGVRTLAGYVKSDGFPDYAFAVMFNGYPGPSTHYKSIQDRMCRVLMDAQHGR